MQSINWTVKLTARADGHTPGCTELVDEDAQVIATLTEQAQIWLKAGQVVSLSLYTQPDDEEIPF